MSGSKIRFDSVDSSPGLMAIGSIDAIASNVAHVVKADRSIYYKWSAKVARGNALVFHDELHSSSAYQLGNCFKDLEFSSKIFTLEKTKTFMGNAYIFNNLTICNLLSILGKQIAKHQQGSLKMSDV